MKVVDKEEEFKSDQTKTSINPSHPPFPDCSSVRRWKEREREPERGPVTLPIEKRVKALDREKGKAKLYRRISTLTLPTFPCQVGWPQEVEKVRGRS